MSGRASASQMRASFALILVGCVADRGERLGAKSDAVIYGEDDRVQAAEADPSMRDRALGSVVALVRQAKVVPCDAVTFDAPTLAEREMVCETEPFADEPTISTCSATLIDDNLVVTAHHCVPDEAACKGFRFVTGLYMEGDSLRAIARQDVYACRRLLVAPTDADIAIVELDRPVTGPYVPAPVGPRVEAGTPLFVAGFPTGIPMKVVTGCEMVEHYVPADEYRTNCDLFAGNSGSGVFGLDGAILGVHAKGPGDWKPRAPGECFVRVTLTEDGRLPDFPSAAPQLGAYTPIERGVQALCDGGYPSARLCGTAPTCAACPSENPPTCPEGCTAPACGDGVCNLGEDFTCPADCGPSDATRCPMDPDPPPVDEPPPANDPGDGIDDTAGDAEVDASGGCAIGGSRPATPAVAVVAIGLALLAARRRR